MPAENPRRRWRLTDQPLAVQFLTAGGIVAFFSIVSLVLLLSQVDSQSSASRFLSQTHQAVGRLNTLGRDFYRQETALLELLRTGDTRYLDSVREGRQLWVEGFAEVDGLLADNVREAEILGGVGESYQAWLKVADALIARQREGAAPDAGALRDESALFKETFMLIDRLISSENRLLSVRDASEKAAIHTTFVAIGAINVALLVMFGIALANLYVSVARPISELSSGISRYHAGDFSARVPVSNQSQIGFLQRSFNEMAEKIEAMVGDLRKLDQLKTEFLSTVSHELRTPLTSIGGYAKLLVAGDAGPVTETQTEFLNIIDTNVVRLTNLINDLLDVEKMELGKVQLVREPQELSSILRECRDTFVVLAAQKGLELRYRVPRDLPPVLGDRARLVQVFMNLVSNAIKYTRSGFVQIDAEAGEYAITVRVRDSGVGITAAEKEKLFQKFYRTRSSLSSTEGGTGLGLVIVRGLVEAHGGGVTVDSVPGEGTVFTVTLPATAPAAPVESLDEVARTAALAIGRPRPVWVVDPDAESVARIARLIGEASLECRAFARVADVPGVEPGAEGPSLVVLDPGSEPDPHRAIPELRRRLHRTVPVLVVSGSVDAAEIFAEGASALLTKPIAEREFMAAVRELSSAKGWRVLVADHNTDLRILVKRGLEQRGVAVDDVDRGSQVLGRLQQESYDLVLVDIGFTDVSGSELLKAIRRGPGRSGLPVLVMSDDDRGTPSGADASIGKHQGIGGIVDSVCRYLEERSPNVPS